MKKLQEKNEFSLFGNDNYDYDNYSIEMESDKQSSLMNTNVSKIQYDNYDEILKFQNQIDYNLFTNDHLPSKVKSNEQIQVNSRPNIFCNRCISNFIQCPLCNGFFKIKKYDKHENFCKLLHDIYKEKENVIVCVDCNSQIKFSEYEKHKSICPAHINILPEITCTHCNLNFPIDMIEEHEIQCENKLTERMLIREKIDCSFCNESVPFTVIELHESTCLKLKENQEKLNKFSYSSIVEFPVEWGEIQNDLEMCSIGPNSSDWRFCEELFKKSVPNVNITDLKIIKNKNLWEKYAREKIRITKEKGSCDENFMFHGTRQNDPKIVYTNGFDISFSSDGGSYGRGIYFARRALYSASGYAFFNNDKYYLFLAKVLTGKCIQIPGNPNLRKPPFYDQARFIYYDSVTNNNNPQNSYDIDQMIIVYNNEKAYPYYLIEYTFNDKNNPDIRLKNAFNIYNPRVNLLNPYVNPNNPQIQPQFPAKRKRKPK